MFHIKELRQSTNLSQKKFAEMFHIPLSTLRKWEQNESSPPPYLLELIWKTLPQSNKGCDIYYGSDGSKYYLNKSCMKVGDSFGNWIPFHEDILGVIEDNIGIYIENLFKKFYEAIKSFDDELKLDKAHHIKWR